MDDKTRILIESMNDEQRLHLTRAATDQIMMLGQEFRASRNRLAEIAGMITSDVSEFTDMIGTIDQTAMETATAEYVLMVRSGKLRLN